MWTILGFIIVVAAVISIRNHMSREIQELREELNNQSGTVNRFSAQCTKLEALVKKLSEELDLVTAAKVIVDGRGGQLPADVPDLIPAPEVMGLESYDRSVGSEDQTVCRAEPSLLVDVVDGEDREEIFHEVDLSSDFESASPVSPLAGSGVFKGLIESVTGSTRPMTPGNGGDG